MLKKIRKLRGYLPNLLLLVAFFISFQDDIEFLNLVGNEVSYYWVISAIGIFYAMFWDYCKTNERRYLWRPKEYTRIERYLHRRENEELLRKYRILLK